MKKVVVALALASVGFSPVFAETKPAEAKKPVATEEQAAKPAASQVKKEGTFLVACDAGCTASPEHKKEMQEHPAQGQAKTQKAAIV